MALTKEQIAEIEEALYKNEKVDNKQPNYFNIYDWLEDDIRLYAFVSERNIGKSTSILKFVKDKCEDTMLTKINPISNEATTKHAEFILLRRNDKEISKWKTNMRQFVATMGWKLKGDLILDRQNDVIGRLVSLSTAHNLASNDMQFVKYIFFDEFISRDNRNYTRNEWKMLNDFIVSAERNQKDMMLFMAANKITNNNPVFNILEWYPKPDEEVKKIKVGKLIFKLINVKEGRYWPENREDSIGYNLAQTDDKLFRFAFKNENSFDNDELIKDPSTIINKQFYKNYAIGNMMFSVYHFDGGFYCDEKNVIDVKPYCLTRESQLIFGSKILCDDPVSVAEFMQNKIITKKIYFNILTLQEVVSKFVVSVLGNINKEN